MYITLKMEIQEQEYTLEVNLANRAGRIYRQQFNRDILKDMTDLYKKLHKSPFDVIDMSRIEYDGKTDQEIYAQIVENVDVTKLLMDQDDATALSFEETERAGQIIWAFVKNRDANTPNYEDWIDEYDFILPVDQIVSSLFEAWNKSAQPTIELKN